MSHPVKASAFASTAQRDRLITAITEGPPLTTRMMKMYLGSCGRIHSPAVLLAAWRHQRITARQLRELLYIVWSYAEYPQDYISDDDWRDMFRAAGYTSHGQPATPPDRIQLFRGSPWEYRRRWSWTDNLPCAQIHAQGGIAWRKEGIVWTLTAPASAILLHRNHIDFEEYVVDTDGLEIRPVVRADLDNWTDRNGLPRV